MIFQKSILFTLILATINLIFCIPQQKDSIAIEENTIYSPTEQKVGEIQSVIELIYETVFNTNINLPVDEEAALLEKEVVSQKVCMRYFLFRLLIYTRL